MKARNFLDIEKDLKNNVQKQFFESPRKFKSLISLLDIVGQHPDYSSNSRSNQYSNSNSTRHSIHEQIQEENRAY